MFERRSLMGGMGGMGVVATTQRRTVHDITSPSIPDPFSRLRSFTPPVQGVSFLFGNHLFLTLSNQNISRTIHGN
jgi:hypothetical protein